MTYQEAMAKLRYLDAIRNGEIECEDPDMLIVPILDAMPQILAALDPSRVFNRGRHDDDDPSDLMTRVAREAWGVAWESCIATQRNERDLYQGDPIAMVVQRVLSQARPNSPLTPEREWEIEFGGGAYRPGMVLEVLAALHWERGFYGPMRPEERDEWRRRQARIERERNEAEEKAEKAERAITDAINAHVKSPKP